ncbi:hypothetical protein GALMADRAFT_147308 [Galerina marginata CBS 339.88]|uniref:Uncharacterized protein n=1 Tax=Galerina marginata (strain CBS 339.88) TaxID=685588 RepID=A0A067SAT4_GALM3|nr:hypothetical protein GALMADRAFT_147308 [Galerina marginata CBS 339.88]
MEAGIAGNEQWGLDVGAHQNHWAPYLSQYNHGDYMGSEMEYKRGDNFSEGSISDEEVSPLKERPRPRMIKKRKVVDFSVELEGAD